MGIPYPGLFTTIGTGQLYYKLKVKLYVHNAAALPLSLSLLHSKHFELSWFIFISWPKSFHNRCRDFFMLHTQFREVLMGSIC